MNIYASNKICKNQKLVKMTLNVFVSYINGKVSSRRTTWCHHMPPNLNGDRNKRIYIPKNAKIIPKCINGEVLTQQTTWCVKKYKIKLTVNVLWLFMSRKNWKKQKCKNDFESSHVIHQWKCLFKTNNLMFLLSRKPQYGSK